VTTGTSILEIGSGWGGFATRASGRGAHVTTTTISAAQHDRVRRLVEERVVTNVTPLMVDWRDLPSRGRRYDRVVSIEMIEAVDWRDYRRYFDAIERCLEPDGMVGLQAICLPDQRYEAGKYRDDFIKRHIFPGGMLPSHGALVDAAVRRGTLQLLDVEDITSHYAETLRRWRERFDAAEEQLDALGYDGWFRRLWRMYLAYCEAAFAERHCTVGQFVFVGPQWRGSPTTGRSCTAWGAGVVP
jgi:cyclopropane-fatty-acyl-phospholipid synthase